MNYKTLPIYGKLIYITVVVFLLTQLWKLIGVLFVWSGNGWVHWLALPSNLNDFLFRPWTLLTYMFCHADLSQDPFHIIFNMLWLWWFGQFFLQNHTSRQLLSFYLTSGIFAGLFFLLCYNIFPYFQFDRLFSYVVGASGAICALIVAVGMNQAQRVIGLNLFVRVVWVKMKWLALAVLGLTVLTGFNGSNTGGQVCHIGGILFGLWYGWMERRGIDICALPMKIIGGIGQWIDGLRRPKMTATRGGKGYGPIGAEKQRDMDYNADRRSQEEQIDAILDKISRHGYDGLTAEEKQMLFDASKRKKRESVY